MRVREVLVSDREQRYIVTSRDFSGGVTIWYVKDSRVVAGGEPAIVARCNNESDARLVRDALNAPADAEAFLRHWLRERMQADGALVEMAIRDFREWQRSRISGVSSGPKSAPG